MANLQEIWKPIKGYELLYHISNFGRVKSLAQPVLEKRNQGAQRTTDVIMRGQNNSKGYLYVSLFDKKRKNKYIHRLVMESFIPNELNLPQVNHKDGNKGNNVLDNLEWCSLSHNMKHAYNTGLLKAGEGSGVSTLTNENVLNIRSKFNSGIAQYILAKEFNVSRATINRIVHRKLWTHL